jgi:hypothetical protein
MASDDVTAPPQFPHSVLIKKPGRPDAADGDQEMPSPTVPAKPVGGGKRAGTAVVERQDQGDRTGGFRPECPRVREHRRTHPGNRTQVTAELFGVKLVTGRGRARETARIRHAAVEDVMISEREGFHVFSSE